MSMIIRQTKSEKQFDNILLTLVNILPCDIADKTLLRFEMILDAVLVLIYRLNYE